MPEIANTKPLLFVRSPKLMQMRNPLSASWNEALRERRAPHSDSSGIDLADLIDFRQLNDTFANYLEVVGLPVAILNLQGEVLASSKWQRLCMEFHRVNEQTLKRCVESDVSLSQEMQNGSGYALYRCRNGLTDCAAPIVIEGQHIANLFIGQFFLKPPEHAYFAAQRAEFGFDPDAYYEALAEVPIIEEDKVPAIMQLLVGLANRLADQSLSEYRLKCAFDRLQEQTQALASAKDAADVANTAKSRFIANISHEMRTPLHQIAGLAKLVRREPITPKQSDWLDKLDSACKNLSAIVETVLEFNQLENNKVQSTDKPYESSIIHEAISAVKAQADAKGLQIFVEESALPPLYGDTDHIKMALFRYLSNAVRFTPTGSITIRSRLEREDDDHAWLRFEVTDTGVGISIEDQKRLFGIFEQIDNSSTRLFGGLGMGLAMTRKLAESMDGTVGCDSSPGTGSTFWFTARLGKAKSDGFSAV